MSSKVTDGRPRIQLNEMLALIQAIGQHTLGALVYLPDWEEVVRWRRKRAFG